VRLKSTKPGRIAISFKGRKKIAKILPGVIFFLEITRMGAGEVARGAYSFASKR
jgi:hypothetical protein